MKMFTSDNHLPIKGHEISAVTFVRDYLQIHLEDIYISFYVWPDIYIDNDFICYKHESYKNILCNQIGKTITDVDLNPSNYVDLFLSSKARLRTDIGKSDQVTADALVYQGKDNSWSAW